MYIYIFKIIIKNPLKNINYKVCSNEKETLDVIHCISIKSHCVNMFADRWHYGTPCYICALGGFAAISTFQVNFHSWLHHGYFKICTKGSYSISSRRRGACFPNLSQNDSFVQRSVSQTVHHVQTVHHIPMVSAL